MRILIYGFGPYRQFRDNVTEKILRAIPAQRGLKKIIFPVRFHKNQFTGAVKAVRPDVIIGLGQCARGRLLRRESRADNKMRQSQHAKVRPIVRGGAPNYLTNLKLDLGRQARYSCNAGSYVCNFSMYVMIDFIKRRKLPALYGFVHVPCTYDPGKAVRVLRQALRSSRINVQSSKFRMETSIHRGQP
jgi:pyrrolidone-carboxylate peptidase